MADVEGHEPTASEPTASELPASEVPASELPAAGRRSPSPFLLGGLVVALVAAVAFVAVVLTHRASSQGPVVTTLRPSGIPASVSTPTANLMALSPVQPVVAPGFHLTDQLGRPTSLAQFRGKAVVLEFMDPHCVDICPIVSQEFVDASHDLGRTGRHVVFLAINVNRYHASPAAMLAFSRQHDLVSIPSWRFVTGSYAALSRSWKDYNVQVEAPNPNADIIHTSVVYFISPSGQERYLAMPQVDHRGKSNVAYLPANQISQWGKGISDVARSMLPASAR